MNSTRKCSNNVSVSVEFGKLSYHIPKSSDFKSILKCLNGNFLAGKLNVIMGQCGAGKSSLLNILAGYVSKNVSGDIFLNGIPRDMKWFKKILTYIMQDDLLQSHITFRELMMFSAHFKLGYSYTQYEKESIVEEIVESLKLKTCLNLMPHQMSAGERKRCSIALELVSDTSVIFLDKPTSGLDYISGKKCIELLKTLANRGKTVICSMHQPSDSDLLLFDHIFLLHDGNCIYTGSVKKLVPYLSKQNFNCPINSNPIDYMIEIASSNLRNMETLVENAKELNKEYRETGFHITRRLTLSEIFARNASETENLDEFPTSYLQQITILTKRRLLQTSRNRLNLLMQFLSYFLVGICTGLIFMGIGQNGANLDRTFMMCGNLVFFVLVGNCLEMSLIYPEAVKILKREHFNRWFRIGPYYISNLLISVQFNIILPNIISVPIYLLSVQPLEFKRYLLFVLPVVLIRMASRSLCMIIGSVFTRKNGVICCTVLCSILFLFSLHRSGVFAEHIVKFIMEWNFARSAIEAMMLAVLYERDDITCEQVYCHYKNPNVLLKDMGIADAHYVTEVLKIVGFVVLFNIIGYSVLKFRTRVLQQT